MVNADGQNYLATLVSTNYPNRSLLGNSNHLSHRILPTYGTSRQVSHTRFRQQTISHKARNSFWYPLVILSFFVRFCSCTNRRYLIAGRSAKTTLFWCVQVSMDCVNCTDFKTPILVDRLARTCAEGSVSKELPNERVYFCRYSRPRVIHIPRQYVVYSTIALL